MVSFENNSESEFIDWNSVHKRIYKGEVFNWEECVDLWGYHYEISKLYEWFVQLKKVD